MRHRFSIVLLGALSLATSSCAPPPRAGSEPKIYGGTPVPNGTWSAVARLRLRQADGRLQTLCSGTLIAADLVLTAGHCLTDLGPSAQQPPLAVVLALANGGEQVVGVTRTAVDPLLRRHPLGYADLGVVFLAEPVRAVTPPTVITGLEATLAALAAAKVTLVGYGEREDGQTDQKLQVTTSVAAATSDEAIAGGGGQDACYGDSGGPGFAGLDKPGVLGVVSRGRQLNCGGGSFLTLVGDRWCWLQEVAAGHLPPEARQDCRLIDFGSSDRELEPLEFAKLCAGQATASQAETIRAVMVKLRADSCAEAGARLLSATELDLSGLRLRDLSPLGGGRQLRRLNLRGNRLHDLAPLRLLTGLKELDIAGNEVVDLEGLAPLEKNGLHILGKRQQLENYQKTEFLRLCTSQEQSPGLRATIQAVKFRTMSSDCATANERLLRLRVLRFSDQGLTDVRALAGLEQVVSLDLSGNRELVEVAALAGLESLTDLDLRGTKVSSVHGLEDLVARGLRIER